MRLHLAAKVPNEGARLTGRWVSGLRGGLEAAAKKLKTEPAFVQRLIEEGMAPVDDVIGRKLGRLAGVHHDDFERPARGWWFDQTPRNLA